VWLEQRRRREGIFESLLSMKIFISSLISGFELVRAAARAAVTTLRHEPIVAEDFGARPTSPQITCLQGVRSADLVLLLLGERYGSVQPSGVSPTHEEFLEAKGNKDVFVFVQQGVSPEPQQAKFIAEVQAWQGGYFRSNFFAPDDLKDAIIRAVHDYQLANASGTVDLPALAASAVALLPESTRDGYSDKAMLNVAIAAGPSQRVMRPAELEAPALTKKLHQQALFGTPQLFDDAKGMSSNIEGDALLLLQENGACIMLTEQGSVVLRLPLQRADRRRDHHFVAIIEEAVVTELNTALIFTAWTLDMIDPTEKLTQVAIAARIDASGHIPWRTQAEQDASPNSGTMGFGHDERHVAQEARRRAALRLEPHRLAEDLMVRLRRLWKTR
jgi:hypothetical protein